MGEGAKSNAHQGSREGVRDILFVINFYTFLARSMSFSSSSMIIQAFTGKFAQSKWQGNLPTAAQHLFVSSVLQNILIKPWKRTSNTLKLSRPKHNKSVADGFHPEPSAIHHKMKPF